MAFEDVVTNKTSLGTKVVTEEDVAYDDCYNNDCKFYNVQEKKCLFETCIFKEIPAHRYPVTNKCIICGTEYQCNIENMRINMCVDCLKALRHLIIAHRNFCVECLKIEKEHDFDQYLKEGDDGSNEDRFE